jgi:lysophospholipase L1-like esterase
MIVRFVGRWPTREPYAAARPRAVGIALRRYRRAAMTVRRGMVSLGDSITRGRGGAPALGVHPQSWAQWVAEALGLPFTNLAADGARAADVLREQVPRLAGPYDLATLYVGANDARAETLDATAYERDVRAIVAALRDAADRVLVLTVPEDLGRPRAGADVLAANRILRSLDGVTLCALEDFGGPRVVLPDAVHPTSPGMVEMANRALAALGSPARVDGDERRDLAARARYARWWGWQYLRDRRRRWAEAR